MLKRTTLLLGIVLAWPIQGANAQAEDEAERARAAEAHELEREVADAEAEMREAESQLAAAASRVAELSTRRLHNMPTIVSGGMFSDRPALGVSIGPAEDRQGPAEGVEVLAVSPGGAASEVGLRAGDVITAVNGESLSAETHGAANQKLLDFMSAVEEGDVIDVEYLRAGKSASVSVAPRAVSTQAFAFGSPDVRLSTMARPVDRFNDFVFLSGERGWGDMEMVKLTEELGRYFGTTEGMLVVRAPKNDAYQLQDGDVILDIDGRKPSSVAHAIRILGSYQHGETLKMRIMRDQRGSTLEIEVPDRRRGAVLRGGAISPGGDVHVVPHGPGSVTLWADDERI